MYIYMLHAIVGIDVLRCCIYFRPWNRREDGMPVSLGMPGKHWTTVEEFKRIQLLHSVR